MLSRSAVVVLAALAARAVRAQSPPQFTPTVNEHLSVKFGTIDVTSAGTTLQKDDTSSAPTLSYEGSTDAPAFLAMMIDFDVQRPGVSGNRTLLHWAQPDFSTQSQPLQSQGDALAPYISPNPPAGQTHTYGLFLYAQKEQTFTVPSDFEAFFKNVATSSSNRIGFDPIKFAASANLGDPIAANYILVGTPSNTSAATSSSASSGSPTTSTGSAGTGSASSTGQSSATPTSGAGSTHAIGLVSLSITLIGLISVQ